MKRAALSLCLLLAMTASAGAAEMRASVDDLIALALNGLSNETILVFVRNRPVDFTGSAEEIVRLKEAGVSEEVIGFLIENASRDPAAVGYVTDGAYASDTSTRQYVDNPRTNTGYAYSSYPSTFYYPRSYYGSFYLGTLLYPSLWYSQRYHGSRVVYRHSLAGRLHLRKHGLRGQGNGGSFFIGGGHVGRHGVRPFRGRVRPAPLARHGLFYQGHGFGFSTGHRGRHLGQHRGSYFGGQLEAGRLGAGHGAGLRRHQGGQIGGVRGGFQGGARGGFGGGAQAGQAGHR